MQKRNIQLLEILKARPKAYKLLLETLKEAKQNSAVELLKKLPDPSGSIKIHEDQTASTFTVDQLSCQSDSRIVCNLNFWGHDLKHTVLTKVRADLVAKMTSEESNTAIISQIEALNYFDHGDIEELITGQHFSQQKRMLAFFAKFADL